MFIFLVFIVLTLFLIAELNRILGTKVGFYIKKEDFCYFSSSNSVKEVTVSEIDKKISEVMKVYHFDLNDFLNKSQKAFEIIFYAYSKGDLRVLKGLLCSRVFQAFSMAINDRGKRSEILEGILVRFIKSEVIDASVIEDDIFLTVKFDTEQSNVLKSKDGSILEGNADFIETCADTWVFSRKISSNSSKWYLHEIQTKC